MEQSLFIELIHRTKAALHTINKLTQLSREKFGDKEFREFFYKTISNDIEKNNLLLNTFLKYIESTTPIPKKNTLIKLIEEVLKRHQVPLEQKRIKILKTFGENLPETIVPDEQLKFIFDSLLQFVIVLMPSDVHIPTQCGHRFRSKVATHSEARWPPVPLHCGRPFRSNLATLRGVVEATLDNRC